MFKTWRRRQWLGEGFRRCTARLASTLVTRRSQPSAPVRSLNRLTILFYSSIISTAAAADSAAKQKRRRQWDVAFAQLEESLHVTTQKPQLLQFIPLTDGEGAESINLGAEDRLWLGQHEAEVPNFPRNSLLAVLRLQDSSSNPSKMKTLRDIENSSFQSPGAADFLVEKIHSKSRVSRASIYASSSRRKFRALVWSPKKHVRVEYSVAKLGIRLLMKARRRMSSDAEETQKFEESLREISNRLRLIFTVDAFNLHGRVERLQYPQYTSGAALADEDRIELHKALANSIRRYALGKDSYELLLRKIAYCLLTSRISPNTTTYNLLISRFIRLRLPHLVEVVIESMRECYMRPDEMSATALLYHYIRTKNHRRFRRFVRKIQGLSGGLMLARPDLPTDGVGSSRLRRHKNKVIQALTIDPQMANLIVRGYLGFGNVAAAFSWLNWMQDQGMQPHPRTLSTLIQYYTRWLNWEPGILIWDQMYAQFFSSGSCEYISLEDSAIAFHSALELCKACRQPQKFHDIYRDGLSRGIPMTKLLRLPSTRRGFSILDDLTQLRNRTLRVLEHRVALLIEDNRKWALHVLASKMLLSNLRLEDLETMFRRFRRQASYMDWLKDRPWLLKAKLRRIAYSPEAKSPFDNHISGRHSLVRRVAYSPEAKGPFDKPVSDSRSLATSKQAAYAPKIELETWPGCLEA